MSRKVFLFLSLVAFIVLVPWLFSACRKISNTKNLHILQQEIPAHFPSPLYSFQDNPLSKEGFELGRKLFYEGRLSIDNNHACASCHEQRAAFGTFEHDRSHGVNNTHTLRNAPVLFNLAWSPALHWDGAYTSLKEEAAQPLLGSHEMGETFNGILEKLQKDDTYRKLFQNVFHTLIIRPEFILKALQQFTGSLVSVNSNYDKYIRGTYTFTPEENAGYLIYQSKCASCHPEPLFTDYSFRNIGLPVDNFLKDYGRMMVTGSNADSLKFKVPTLRNTYLSSNYMHDGRFITLEQVIDHYRFGVQSSATLDPSLSGGINLTNTQAANLTAFLQTLTDSSFIKDIRFAKP